MAASWICNGSDLSQLSTGNLVPLASIRTPHAHRCIPNRRVPQGAREGQGMVGHHDDDGRHRHPQVQQLVPHLEVLGCRENRTAKHSEPLGLPHRSAADDRSQHGRDARTVGLGHRRRIPDVREESAHLQSRRQSRHRGRSQRCHERSSHRPTVMVGFATRPDTRPDTRQNPT